LFFLAAVACLWTAGRWHASLIRMRADYRLDSVEPLENAPPLVAFTTVVLGGFRGLLADILWLRASYLQDEGRYIELVQLSDWITKLEPRHTEIWAFHAWNMAYNVSVMMFRPEDRWRWVRNGIQLLRDEGIRYNSADSDLYCNLGWLFQDKIGGTTDRVNMFYKQKWAEEMMELFGGPRPDYEKLASRPEIARRMREQYKLVPEIMRKIDSKYGPLDWRLPESHAIYWAYRGRQHAAEKGSLVCDRMIFQSMAASFMNGRLIFRPDDNVFLRSPNPDLLSNVMKAYDSALEKHGIESVRVAYANFLRNAVLVLYRLNREQEAREVFSLLGEKFPSAETAENFEAFVPRGNMKTAAGDCDPP